MQLQLLKSLPDQLQAYATVSTRPHRDRVGAGQVQVSGLERSCQPPERKV